MDIESVRALKAELTQELIGPMLATDNGIRSFGMRATTNNRVTNVIPAIALGVARGRGKEYKLAVRVQRRSLERDEKLREEISRRAKAEIDFRYIGRIYALQGDAWHQSRRRPLLIGASVAHHRVTAGTIGCFPTSLRTQRPVLLSNNHVLAVEDRGRQGDEILQPGPFDSGRRNRDRVGTLLDFVPLKRSRNRVDAAIVSIDADVEIDPRTLTGLGVLAGVRGEPLQTGDRVAKVGRTTGVTHGVVTAAELDDVVVGYDRGALSFDDQIEIEGDGDAAFSAGGDSGSMIVDDEMRACALLFAGGDAGGSNGKGLTYANPIADVLGALGLAIG